MNQPTSHTTVRTVRYTAVQPHKCNFRRDSYCAGKVIVSCLYEFLVINRSAENWASGNAPIAQSGVSPFVGLPFLGMAELNRNALTLALGIFHCFQMYIRSLRLSHFIPAYQAYS